jgi:threonine dehydratase
MNNRPTLIEVRQAADRIKPYAHRTPVLTCSSINRMLDVQIFFKCENFQKVGAFKFRGACNTIFSLSESEAAHGVATHSSGNHAAAVALAARMRGIKAFIVMPKTAPQVKKAAVAEYGGEIVFCEPTLESREKTLAKVLEEAGATVVHPYNDHRVIAGQGTAALELLEEAPELDIVMTPVGGGGLLSGTSITVSELSPATLIMAAEPEGADDAYRSLQENRIVPSINPKTIADGLLTSLGDLTFPIIKQHVHQIVTVSDKAIVAAMRMVWERMKIIIEPSAAVTVAALLEGKVHLAKRRVGVILTGGNLDLERLPWTP